MFGSEGYSSASVIQVTLLKKLKGVPEVVELLASGRYMRRPAVLLPYVRELTVADELTVICQVGSAALVACSNRDCSCKVRSKGPHRHTDVLMNDCLTERCCCRTLLSGGSALAHDQKDGCMPGSRLYITRSFDHNKPMQVLALAVFQTLCMAGFLSLSRRPVASLTHLSLTLNRTNLEHPP
jgi:hypothetical protein